MMSDKTVEEISECSPGLDEESKERIINLCEKKLGILENSEGSDKSEKEAEVQKYTAPKWYRTAIAAAACLLIVTCVVIVKNNIKTSDPDTKNPVVTSQREETTETSVSQTTENTETDKADTDYVEKYRKIVEEIDYQMANISNSEATFVNLIYDLLQDSEMNQSEIMKYLKQISFFSKFAVGEKKVISWLEKWAKNGKWACEQRVNEKNAKFYYVQTAKLAKLPNNNKIGS